MTRDSYHIATIIATVLVLASCGAAKQTPQTVIEYRDTTIIREHFVYDTVEVKVPEIIERNVTRDTSSHLENPWGKSDALVRDGFLWHTLETIPRTIEVPVTVAVHDTVRIEKEAQILTQTVEVERKLSFWQRLKIGAFWWLSAAVVALLLWTFRKFLFKMP